MVHVMNRIPAVDPTTVVEPVKSLLAGVQQMLGATPNLFRVAAQSPAALDALVGLFGAVGKGRLNARARAAVALAVSETNGCDYCLSAHAALGKAAGLTPEAIAQARDAGSDDAKLGAVLRLTRALVERRGHVAPPEVDQARAAGLTDAEMLEVVANVALTTFTNYLNELAGTEIDFPVVHQHAR